MLGYAYACWNGDKATITHADSKPSGRLPLSQTLSTPSNKILKPQGAGCSNSATNRRLPLPALRQVGFNGWPKLALLETRPLPHLGSPAGDFEMRGRVSPVALVGELQAGPTSATHAGRLV